MLRTRQNTSGHINSSLIAALVISAFLLGVSDGRAQDRFAFSFLLGTATIDDADVRLTRPGGTDLDFGGVAWDDESLVSPVYFGLRLEYRLPKASGWAVALDFAHPKMIARLHETVPVNGTREGEVVAGDEVLGDTFAKLEFTHGYNLLTANALYRFFSGTPEAAAKRRVRPYLGFGIGIAVPHVEVIDGISETHNYQIVGPAAQVLGGVDIPVTRRLSVLGEARMSWADVTADLEGGGTVEVEPWTGQLAVGLSFAW
jgi:lipid A oxidase